MAAGAGRGPRAEPLLISAAVNTFSQCLAWAHADEEGACPVAFGAHHWVALATAAGEVRHKLRGHGGAVQCVEWVVPGRQLASGSADGTVRIWARGARGAAGEEGSWGCAHVLSPSPQQQQQQQQPPPVTRLVVLRRQEGVFLACASSGGITLWSRRADDDGTAAAWEAAFSTAMPAVQIPTALALVPLGCEAWALLAGAVDARIHVWTGAFTGGDDAGGGASMEWRRAGSLVGHQGWIRSLAWRPLAGTAGVEQEQGVWVASGSQDGKIRLWKIEPLGEGAPARTTVDGGNGGDEEEEEEEEEGGATDEEEEDDHEVRLVLEAPGPKQKQKPRRFGVRLDALLVGHEDWVTGVSWHPPRSRGADGAGAEAAWPLALLSCSMDRSLIIWRPEGARGVWTPRVRLGDLGADLGGAVGSNLLGFLGCAFDARGTTVLGHGFGGSMHAYRLVGGGDEEEEYGDGGLWRPVSFATGHFEEVTDVQWERWRGDEEPSNNCGLGRYLVSVSKDQTTRLWAPVAQGRWHEVSRVQVHGYDLACVDLLPRVAYRLVSGADEKTLRVFDATSKVLGLLQELCGLPPPAAGQGEGGRVETAYMQALALSTKAAAALSLGGGSGGGDNGGQGEAGAAPAEKEDGSQDALALDRARARVSWAGRGPPLEGELVDHTLWPEVAKLYGHGSGLTCLAADHAGRLVASACKARDPEMARVRLWDTATWRAPAGGGSGGAAALPGHQSTVVQLAFSHDDAVLASVSKDRQVCLYARTSDGDGIGYRPAQTLAKAHKRIVWSCAWSHDDALLATGSRDGTFKLWRRAQPQQDGNAPQPILEPLPLASRRPAAAGATPAGGGGTGSGGGADSVTAVAFAPRLGADGRHLLAVGLDSGDVELWAGGKDDGASWACVLRFEGSLPHAATVKRLRWRQAAAAAAASVPGALELASCGSDHAVKVARIMGV